jgi:hypothetical protein
MVTRCNIQWLCGVLALSLVLPSTAWGQADPTYPDGGPELAEPPTQEAPEGEGQANEPYDEPTPDEPSKKKRKNRKKATKSPKRKRQRHISRIHHAPISVADVAEPLTVRASLDQLQGSKRAWLVYRTSNDKRFRQAEFLRAADGPYAAVVPAERVMAPALEYVIELEQDDGKRVAVFSSRRSPHRVLVPRDGMDRIEEVAAARLDERRSMFSADAEYVSFGRSPVVVDTPTGREEQVIDDFYWRAEGSFTYRLLRTVSEFSFTAGAIRGSAPSTEPVPGQSEDERFDVGLNYGATRVRFRMTDKFHVDGSLLASVSELGFSVGTGSSLHIGDPYGSKLILGFEAIESFGVRIFTRLDFQAHRRVKLSPIVEVTNMPSAVAFGLRLQGELGVDIGWGLRAIGRGGYQARDATSGGPSAGGSLGYAF